MSHVSRTQLHRHTHGVTTSTASTRTMQAVGIPVACVCASLYGGGLPSMAGCTCMYVVCVACVYVFVICPARRLVGVVPRSAALEL